MKKISNFLLSTTVPLTLLTVQISHAQTHDHHSTNASNVSAVPANYAGQQNRTIKALSAQEQQDWLDGKGQGLAKAAELNGYPGPMHVLEHADALKLSTSQREQTQSLLLRHKASVKDLGLQLIAHEKLLDSKFAAQEITPENLNATTAKIAALQGRIRAEHLTTHIEQKALLSAEQVAQYKGLRGYVN